MVKCNKHVKGRIKSKQHNKLIENIVEDSENLEIIRKMYNENHINTCDSWIYKKNGFWIALKDLITENILTENDIETSPIKFYKL